MRARLALMMAMIVMAVSLAACGGKNENKEAAGTQQDTGVENTAENEATPEPAEQTADSGSASTNKGIEVDEGLLNVEINISAESAEFYGIKFESQEEADNYAKEQGFKSVTLNDDGSITIIMSKSKHREFMKGFNESLDQALQEMIGSEQYPDIVAIEHNDDYTEFKITTRSEELGLNESFSVIGFYMYGAIYNSFSGKKIDNIHVDFINEDSGEVIDSFDSKNWGDSTDEASQDPDTESQTSGGEETVPGQANDQTGKTDEKAAKTTKAAYTIADEVLVDDENCSFIITKAEDDNIWGFTLKAFCENKTEDHTLMFSIDNATVNGYMVDPAWAEEVAAGKKSNDEISFSSSALKSIGIDSADEVTFTLRVYDSDNWTDDAFVEETFTIYPTGLSADTVTYPDRKTTPTEQIVVDNDDISFVILESEVDNIWGYTLHCYIENKTDEPLMFSWNNVSVNGYMIDPFWAKEVVPGRRCYTDISFSKDEFAKNDITSVEDIEYSMRVYNSDDWSDDSVFEETLAYNP